MTNRYEFGANVELDQVRVNHNLSKVIRGECGRKKKRNKKGVFFKGL